MAATAAVLVALKEKERKLRREADHRLRAIFKSIDEDGSGQLDEGEMLNALANIGFDKTDPVIVKRVRDAAGEDHEINFNEFKESITMLADTGALDAKLGLKPETWATRFVPLPFREQAHAFYNHGAVQLFVASVIIFNFFAIIVEKELDPAKEPEFQLHYGVWRGIDNACNVIFLVELALNLYSSWWRPFLVNPWNYLDTVVVVVGLLSLLEVDLGSFSQIKILRAFRIVRLFKRVKSLNQILVSLLHSIPGVINAMIVLAIFMFIYAIIAVDLFREFGAGGDYDTVQTYGPGGPDAQWGPGAIWATTPPSTQARFERRHKVSAMTPRGFHFGQEYYGTFSRALFTLFQVMTGESWCEMVVRPLMLGWDPRNAIVTGIFFISFVLITAVVLQNVVVTVLLDKFLASNDEQETNERKAATERMEALLTLLGASAGSSMSSPLRAYSEASGGLDAWVKGKEYAQVRADMDALMLETRWAKNAIASVLEALPERHAPPLKKTISLPTEKVALVASIHPGSSKRSPLAGSPLGAPTVV